ncbi:MAG: alpha/beta hydrolase [Betaproteobacteria bacterium]|jgi:haloacetate dehalogenase|nr:MAG: alpha/beta hydrolase [Betaproteobacteria bacterium]
MFEGFTLKTIDTGTVNIRARIGGNGAPVLLLHGNPQTHVMWHAVAPALAEHFTVVATDLTGYGMSSKPPSSDDHAAYSKRNMAKDQIAVMRKLGHEQFMVAGHDRGGRVAYRMALDHPDVVQKLAVLDIIPTLDAFERAGKDFGLGYYHWFFLAQPAPLPETLINANPDWFWRWHTDRVPRRFFAPEAVEDYLNCFRNPETVRAICEDYRAAAGIDCEIDAQDQAAGRRINLPVLALWGKQARLEQWYDTLAVWRGWADDVQGGPLDCGHYLPEEKPDDTAAALIAFFG